MRQTKRRHEFNLKTKSAVKDSVKNVRKLIQAGKKTEAAEAMRDAMSSLDKAVKKNVMHKNTAARKKSRLAKSLAK